MRTRWFTLFIIASFLCLSLSFVTPAQAVVPGLTTLPADSITRTSGRLNGQLNGMGQGELESPAFVDTDDVTGNFAAGLAVAHTSYTTSTNFYVAIGVFYGLVSCFASDNAFMVAVSPTDTDAFPFIQRGCATGEAAWYEQVTIWTLGANLSSQASDYNFRFNDGNTRLLTLQVSSWSYVNLAETPVFINGVDSGHPPDACGTGDATNSGLSPGVRGVIIFAAEMRRCGGSDTIASATGTQLWGISAPVCDPGGTACSGGSYIRTGTSHLFDFTATTGHVFTTAGLSFHGNQTFVSDVSEDVYFEWGATPGLGNTTVTASLTSPAVFRRSLSGLAQETTYYYRACANGTSGSSCGATLTFTTQGVPVLMQKGIDAAITFMFLGSMILVLAGAWWIKKRRGGGLI